MISSLLESMYIFHNILRYLLEFNNLIKLLIILHFQGFVLVYDVTSVESFKKLEKLKREIDKHKDKREVCA